MTKIRTRKPRTHGKRCNASHSSWKRCRCVCRGKEHGAAHRPPGLLQNIADGQPAATKPKTRAS